jgi:hypothetical protein
MTVSGDVDMSCVICTLGGTLCRYQDQGKLDKAIEFGEKALNITIKVLGEEHPDVATSYGNLGNA